MDGERWCYHHHPRFAEERRRNSSRAATLGNSKIGAEIAQLLQVYARLADLEIAAGERPRAGEMALPEDTGQRVRQWTEGEAESKKQREIFMGKLQAVEKDPRSALEGMG